MSYTPRPGTVAYRVIDFLQRNEGEELTRSDIAAKFECAAASLDTILADAMRAGLLDRHRGDEGVAWRLGQKRITLAAEEGPQATSAAAAPRASRVLVDVDPKTINIRKGIGLQTPEQRRRAEFTAWFDQFGIGDSAEFDDVHTPTIRVESKRHAKATGRTYRIASVGTGRAGVERTA